MIWEDRVFNNAKCKPGFSIFIYSIDFDLYLSLQKKYEVLIIEKAISKKSCHLWRKHYCSN